MTSSATQPRELIPGYLATERLGAGGYGEVWKVEAPGGLIKAVKLIYGYLGDERAERELKALQRVKQVRHPFVLSLERIEVVDGRLFIVTELADMSLMDRFEQCRNGQLRGIPRTELLTYVQDAADALDYMQQTHSLQHLDVKPENLLIVGGRAKVADFGLVKELTDCTRSMVGAMTPTYAAPELFDGKASEFCDQYSLAILYQEMLTGVLPFPGRTAAQLAAQHTQSQPQLQALAPAQRPIVARALAKRPQDRFPTCRDFVRALLDAQSETDAGETHQPAVEPDSEKHDTGTLNMDDTHRAEPPDVPQATEEISARLSSRSIHVAPKLTMLRPRLQVSTEVVDVPPPAAPQQSADPAKTLLVGLGGTGVKILGRLNQCLQELGESDHRPDVQMLAFDTDRQMARRAADVGLDPDNFVLLRLRQAHDYRADSQDLLKWIGRRWLYNVPKSAETGGFRPLGRLALVDHAGVVVSRLRRRLSGMVRDDAEEVADGESSPVPLRVVLVGACSGGTGGGMLIEMAHAVQNVARQLGRDHVDVTALITHATDRCRTSKQLAQANAYSFLSELQHYAHFGSLSEQTSAPQTAIYESDQWPIRDLYFCHLGDDLDSTEFKNKTHEVAQYLLSDVATPLGGILQGCRRESNGEPPEDDVHLRSFRLHKFDGVGHGVSAGIQAHFRAHVVNKWFAPSSRSAHEQLLASQDEPDDAAAEGPSPDDTLPRILEPLGPVLAARQIRQSVDRFMHRAMDDGGPPPELHEALAIQLQGLCDELRKLREESGEELPPLRKLAGALAVSEGDLRHRLEDAADTVAEQLLAHSLQLERLRDQTQRQAADSSLRESLAREAVQFTDALLKEWMPHTRPTADGQLRPDVAAMTTQLGTSESRVPSFGCQRRTLVLRPAAFGIDDDFAAATQRPCGFVDADTASVVVCEEMEQISLAQIANGLVTPGSEIRTVASRIHTRADIKWTEPPLIQSD